MSDDFSGADWDGWVREAALMMEKRNEAWINKFGLNEAPYHFDFDPPLITFARAADRVIAKMCLIGTSSMSSDSFLWGWADEFPEATFRRLSRVREFGRKHRLDFFNEPGVPEEDRETGPKMLAASARILDAEGALVQQLGGATCYFALFDFRTIPANESKAPIKPKDEGDWWVKPFNWKLYSHDYGYDVNIY